MSIERTTLCPARWLPAAGLTLLVAGIMSLWTVEAAAVLPSPETAVFEIPLPETEIIQDAGTVAAAAEAAELLSRRYGGKWQPTLWNPASRTAQLMWGPGTKIAGLSLATDASAKAAALSFVAANEDILRARARDLVVEDVARAAGKVGVHFGQRFHGIPVHGGRVKTIWSESGAIIAFGSSFYSGIDVSPVPAVSAAEAEGVARAALPFNPATDQVLGAAELMVLPVPVAGGGARFHLVWRVVVGTEEPYGVWATHVDAHDRRIVWRANEVHSLYSGRSQGDVDQTGYCDGQENSDFRNMTITVTGIGAVATDSTGSFSLAGTGGDRAITCQFLGPKLNVDDLQFPPDSQFNGTVQENVPLTINWTDATPSLRTERDVFYWVNETYAYVKRMRPAFDLGSHVAQVNVNDFCNATYNWSTQTMRFFREGNGCANTGTIGDVVAHEYGHGVHQRLVAPSAPSDMGEGNADIMGTFMTDDPLIGRGFFLNMCASGLPGRNCDNTLRYPGDVIGQPIHDAGRVICGFNWDLRQLLEAKLGAEAGKTYTAQLWTAALDVNNPTTQPDEVSAYFLMDDDDADIGNGSPNFDELCEAAMAHGFSCPLITEFVAFTHTPLTDTTDPGPYTVAAAIIAAGSYPLDTSSPTLFYSLNGGAYSSVSMTHLGGDNFEADIPGQSPGTAVAYYIVAENTNGTVGESPDNAPENYYVFGVGTFTVLLDDNVETDQGWTVTELGNNNSSWERADPNGTVSGPQPVNPENDHTADPGVICWVTGNPPPGSSAFTEEVDGRTTLQSPLMDLAGGTLARGTVWLWAYMNNYAVDFLDFEISTDGGSSWSLMERIAGPPGASGPNQWLEHPFTLGPFGFNFTSQTRFRFVADDGVADNVLDCAMDDFHLRVLTPGSTAVDDPIAARPLSFALQGSRPNPFNPQAEIRYQLPVEAPVKLAIFDVSGREIRVLVDGVKEPGMHGAVWDGKDGSGKAMGSGVYFYRLKAGDFEETRRMTLVK